MSVISSLVAVTLHTLDDAVSLAANWVLELLDECENLEKATGIKISRADIDVFQKNVATPFMSHLKDNISSRFASSSDIVSSLSIFDPKQMPRLDSDDLPHYGEIVLAHS